jgi:hypothetical protein
MLYSDDSVYYGGYRHFSYICPICTLGIPLLQPWFLLVCLISIALFTNSSTELVSEHYLCSTIELILSRYESRSGAFQVEAALEFLD